MEVKLRKYWFRFKEKDADIYYERFFCSTSKDKAEGYAEVEAKNYNLFLIEYIGWTDLGDNK